MIELIKEKSFTAKDFKERFKPPTALFDLTKTPTLTCTTFSAVKNDNNFLIFYIGLSNGKIVRVKISQQKNLYKTFEEVFEFPCDEEDEHKGSITDIINVIIEGKSFLITSGIDNKIKFWNTEVEKNKKNYYIKTIKGHTSSVLNIRYCISKDLLLSSSCDKTLRVWKLEKVDKLQVPYFKPQQIIKVEDKIKTEEQIWFSTFSVKENDKIELYAGDTKGNLHIYVYIDEEDDLKSYDIKNAKLYEFNKLKSVKLHKSTCTQIIHSPYDPLIYSISYDTHMIMIGYEFVSSTEESKKIEKNFKGKITEQLNKTIKINKLLDISNTNKSYFTSLHINNLSQELLCGDEKGGLTFIKIFDKSQNKIKAVESSINYLQTIEIFSEVEHLIIGSEDALEVFRIKRASKPKKNDFHDDIIVKLIAIEQVKKGNIIIEDAKVISCSYDNKLKIWDFISMECICEIDIMKCNLLENLNKNAEISTMCYIPNANMIAIGLDIGIVLFWDMKTSDFTNTDYHKKHKHKSNITCILNAQHEKKDKEKEFLFTTSYDGNIFIWTVEAIEMILSKLDKQDLEENKQKKKAEAKKAYDKVDVLLSILEYDKESELLERKKKEMKNKKTFRYIPVIKFVLNTITMIKEDKSRKSEIFALCFISEYTYLFSGGADGNIYVWNIDNYEYVNKLSGHKESVTTLVRDKNILFSGSSDATIIVWNPKNMKSNPILNVISLLDNPSLINCLSVVDIIILPQYGLLISFLSNKSIKFIKYEKGETIKVINTKETLNCGTIVNSYGKLLCGTKEKTIMEIDLAEIFDNFQLKHNLTKFPFMSDQENYILHENDKKINNFHVMNLIAPKNDLVKK